MGNDLSWMSLSRLVFDHLFNIYKSKCIRRIYICFKNFLWLRLKNPNLSPANKGITRITELINLEKFEKESVS